MERDWYGVSDEAVRNPPLRARIGGLRRGRGQPTLRNYCHGRRATMRPFSQTYNGVRCIRASSRARHAARRSDRATAV